MINNKVNAKILYPYGNSFIANGQQTLYLAKLTIYSQLSKSWMADSSITHLKKILYPVHCHPHH